MKKLTLAMLGSLACLAAAAAEFAVTPDREIPVYRAGEKAIVTVSVQENGAPLTEGVIQYEITNDGLAQLASGSIDLAKTNPAQITVTMDQPGIARLTLKPGEIKVTNKADNKRPSPISCGLAFSPEKIAYASDIPKDFVKFWMDGRKAIANRPVKLIPLPNKRKDLNTFKVVVDSLNGPVYGFLAVPNKPGKYPAAITVPGAGPGSPGPEMSFAQKGYITLVMNVHEYENPTDAKEARAIYAEQGKRFYYPVKNAHDRDTYFFRRVILGVDRAINYVASMKEYNGREMIMHGSSQGGAMTLIMTGLNKNITVCAANVPAMCDHLGVAGVRPEGWPHALPKASPEKAQDVARTMAYFDAANFATFIRVPTLVSCGLIDGTCPPSSVFVAYNRLGTKTKQMYYMPGLGHVQTPDYVNVRDAWFQKFAR